MTYGRCHGQSCQARRQLSPLHARSSTGTWQGVRVIAHQVIGLSDDGARVVLKVGDLTVEVPLEEIRRAERKQGRAQPVDAPLSPMRTGRQPQVEDRRPLDTL